MSIETQRHTSIFHIKAARPEHLVIVQDPAFRSVGILIEDEYDTTGHGRVKVKALASATSWFEVTWTEPTTVVGVQFFGDERQYLPIRIDEIAGPFKSVQDACRVCPLQPRLCGRGKG